MYCGECKAYIEEECGGCGSGIGVAKEFSKVCNIALCAGKKNIEFCLDCDDFPCRHIDYFKAKSLRESAWFVDIVSNMKEIRELGADELCRRKDAQLNERLACAKDKGVPFCNECKDWPCDICKNVPLLSEPDVPP